MKLFIAKVHHTTTEAELKSLLSTAGEVNSVVIAKNPAGLPKGFAFAEMASEANAQQAINTLNGHILNGMPIVVLPQQQKEQLAFGHKPHRPAPRYQTERPRNNFSQRPKPRFSRPVVKRTRTEDLTEESVERGGYYWFREENENSQPISNWEIVLVAEEAIKDGSLSVGTYKGPLNPPSA